MAFPYMNAASLSQPLFGLAGNVLTPVLSLVAGNYNIASLPAVVDVSGMEFSVGVVSKADTTTLSGGIAGGTGSSTVVVTFVDGGPTGDATGVAVLMDNDKFSNSAVFTAQVPRDQVGTALTDLDADDWVNFRVVANLTGAGGIGAVQIAIAYIYGKPAVIN